MKIEELIKIPAKHKIFTITVVLLLILGGVCAVDAGKFKTVKDAVINIATGETLDYVVTHANEINTGVTVIKYDFGTYEKANERYRHDLEELESAKQVCLSVMKDPSQPKYNVEYCEDSLNRIEAAITTTNYKIQANEKAIAKAKAAKTA